MLFIFVELKNKYKIQFMWKTKSIETEIYKPVTSPQINNMKPISFSNNIHYYSIYPPTSGVFPFLFSIKLKIEFENKTIKKIVL